MKIVYYSKDAQFELTDEEFNDFIGKAQNFDHVWIERLKTMLSSKYIWAGEKPEDPNVRTLKDGSKAIWKNGQWVDYHDNNVKIDTAYYPELARKKELTEHEINKQFEPVSPSEFSKKLSSRFQM